MALGNKKNGKQSSSLTTDKATADKAMDEHMKETYGSEPITTPTPETVALYVEDKDTNEMLTRSAQWGEALSNDTEFVADLDEVIKAAEIDDYKSIAMAKWLERTAKRNPELVSLALLPWPGTELATVKAARKEGDNTPLVFDKPKASGGRAKTETFYGNLVKHTPRGKLASAKLEALITENAQALIKPDAPETRTKDARDTDKEDADRVLNKSLAAIRNAAKIHILLAQFKEKLPHISIKWVRDEGEIAEVDMPNDTDWTKIDIDGVGPVRHSRKVLRIYSKRNPAGEASALRYPIGSFLRWKPDRAIEIAKANQRNFATMDDVIASGQGAPKTTPTTPPAASTLDAKLEQRWKQQDMVDVKRALDGTLTWVRGSSPVEQEQHVAQLMKSLNASDEMNASLYGLYQILRPIYETDKTKVERATEYWAKAGEKVA